MSSEFVSIVLGFLLGGSLVLMMERHYRSEQRKIALLKKQEI
mgnify:CR=1 FL=1